MHQWRNIVNFLNVNHSVHPSEPVAPQHSEFLQVNNNVRIRVIHVKAKVSEEIKEVHGKPERKSQCSLYEEYWFTRNKPSKYQRCSCSFRRSQRFSELFSAKNKEDERISNNDTVQNAPLRKIELFVENIINDCLFDAFKEYVAIIHPLKGCNNLGFENSEDWVDVGLKNLKKAVIESKIETNGRINSLNQSSEVKIREESDIKCNMKSAVKKKCTHQSSDNSKPLVILFHGIGTSADAWWSVINCLSSNGHEVVAPDMLGHGYSSVPNRANMYKFKSLVKHALAVFEHYIQSNKTRKIILIAHSLGCSIATAVCRHKVEHVSLLILISGGGPTPLAPPVEREVPLISCLQTIFKPLLFCGVKRTLLYSSRGKHFECADPNQIATPTHVLHYIEKGQYWPEGDAGFHRKIHIPTLLVYGLQDKQVTLVQECEMERTIPRSFLELIPNCGHFPMLETPEQLNHMITCFIDWWTR